MNLTPDQNERLRLLLPTRTTGEIIISLQDRLLFWQIVSAGMAITIIVLLILWPN